MIGIYKFQNKINGKVYIGQSINIADRYRHHLNAKDEFHIHRAIRKYGIDNFWFDIIDICDESELNDHEIWWITYYDSFKHGYNSTIGGEGARGFTRSEEQIKKWRKSYHDFLEVNGSPWQDKHHKDETKQKISEGKIEYYKTHEHPWKDRHHKDETKQIISNKRKNYCQNNTIVWVTDDIDETLIIIDFLSEYLSKGYVRGRKKKYISNKT